MNYRYKTKNFLMATTAVFALSAANPALSQGIVGDAWVSVEAGMSGFEMGYNGYSRGVGEGISYVVDESNIGYAFEVGVDLANTPYSLSLGMRNSSESRSGYDEYSPYFGEQEAGYTTLDFEVGRDVNLGPAGSGRVTLGVRHANVSASSSYSYNYSESVTGQFTGIGPRIALETSVPIMNNVSLDVEAGLAVLFGSTENSYTEYNGFYGQMTSSNTSSTTVTNLDFSAALAYLIGSNSKVSLGYRVEQFGGLNMYSDYGAVDEIVDQSVFLKFTTRF